MDKEEWLKLASSAHNATTNTSAESAAHGSEKGKVLDEEHAKYTRDFRPLMSSRFSAWVSAHPQYFAILGTREHGTLANFNWT